MLRSNGSGPHDYTTVEASPMNLRRITEHVDKEDEE